VLRFVRFASLGAISGVHHAFTQRVPGVEVSHEKGATLHRLDSAHRQIRAKIGLGEMAFFTAEQVHGTAIGIVDDKITPDLCFAKCDGIITNRRGVCLGIYVADCCAVFIVDPVRSAVGLVHSGRKGTELGIASSAIELMSQRFKSDPRDLIVQLSPCIRPPHYEVDFAAEIVWQCRAAGVESVHDCGKCTACDLQSYYSYRVEKGRTGRMLALLALA